MWRAVVCSEMSVIPVDPAIAFLADVEESTRFAGRQVRGFAVLGGL